MSDLQTLAHQKSTAFGQALIDGLPGTIDAMRRRRAANGSLRSGAMLKEVVTICKGALAEQRDSTIKEYRWAVSHALMATGAWVAVLNAEARSSIGPVAAAGANHIRAATEFIAMPHLEERLQLELARARELMEQEISLSLQSAFAEKSRGLVGGLLSPIIKLIGRAIGR